MQRGEHIGCKVGHFVCRFIKVFLSFLFNDKNRNLILLDRSLKFNLDAKSYYLFIISDVKITLQSGKIFIQYSRSIKKGENLKLSDIFDIFA